MEYKSSNNSLKVQILKKKIQVKNPSILLLQETKCSKEWTKEIGSRAYKVVVLQELMLHAQLAEALAFLWNPNKINLWNFMATPISISRSSRW